MKSWLKLARMGALFALACPALGFADETAPIPAPGAPSADAERIAALERRVAELELRMSEIAEPPGEEDAPTEAMEQEAGELLRVAGEASEKGRYDEARAVLGDLKARFPTTRAAVAAGRLEHEVQLIGSAAPAMATERFFQGRADFTQSAVTLVVFWETWCPHCKREVPKLEPIFNRYKGRGLNVVGLTKQTRDTTNAQTMDFIRSNRITFPIAKEQGEEMSTAFGVRGVPAAAAVRDGKIIWRGHPARLTDELIAFWLSGS